MKGTLALPVLLVGAIAAGGLLYLGKRQTPHPASAVADPALDAQRFVERETGLTFPSPPDIVRHADDDLRPVIGTRLDERFGPEGLTHRSRAYDLLQLLPPGQNLRGLLVAAQGAGARAWFDDQTGTIHTVAAFDPARPDDHATLVRFQTRQLIQHNLNPTADHPGDDAWIIREAVHAGIAKSVEERFVTSTGGARLPTSEETERQGILLSLPVFLHNLAQIDEMQGRDFVESRRTDGTTPWQNLIDQPPARSLDLFVTAVPSTPPPALPDTPGTGVFEESLGAYSTMILLERLSDYLLAEGVAPAWRGDRYRLFTTGTGDHLVWRCRWANPEAATKAAAIIRNTLSPTPADPSFGIEPRHTRLTTTGATLLFLNCADARTLQLITNNW